MATQALEVIVIGSGTSVPHGSRRPPAFAVRSDEVCLLVDCGAGCSTGLAACGITLDQLSGILLTHLHPDHTADLVPILFALHNPLGPVRHAELPLCGPLGTLDHLQGLAGVYGEWIKPRGAGVPVRELKAGEVLALRDFTVRPFAVKHAGPCFAYRIEAGGHSVCFSGDTGVCEGLQQAARGVDLLLCECAALEREGAPGHLSADEVGRLATGAACRRLVLTHLYPHVVASDPLARVRRHFSGPVSLAEDGQRLQVDAVAGSRGSGPGSF